MVMYSQPVISIPRIASKLWRDELCPALVPPTYKRYVIWFMFDLNIQ